MWLHVLMCESVVHSLLSLNSFLLNEYTSLLIHSLFGGPLGCFQFVVIFNKVTMNILVQIFVWTVISFMDSVFGVISKKVSPYARSFRFYSRSFNSFAFYI